MPGVAAGALVFASSGVVLVLEILAGRPVAPSPSPRCRWCGSSGRARTAPPTRSCGWPSAPSSPSTELVDDAPLLADDDAPVDQWLADAGAARR